MNTQNNTNAHAPVARPKNGMELFELMIAGAQAEVKTGKVMAALGWLESNGTTWTIDVKPSENEGWHVLTPDADACARIQREVERDESEDIAAEKVVMAGVRAREAVVVDGLRAKGLLQNDQTEPADQ